MSAFRFIAALVTLIFTAVNAPNAMAAAAPRKAAPTAKAKTGLEQSKRFKAGKDHTKVDFDETSIEGQAKNPFGTLLNSRDQDFNRGFIKLRYDWHDHMRMGAMGMSQ